MSTFNGLYSAIKNWKSTSQFFSRTTYAHRFHHKDHLLQLPVRDRCCEVADLVQVHIISSGCALELPQEVSRMTGSSKKGQASQSLIRQCESIIKSFNPTTHSIDSHLTGVLGEEAG